ncbi:3-isopropylmalate dehydratase small subunit [Microbacterium sp.]|uniref:LeuD/DmdB family oxidoreductase small subunit n=1 Tax=Microbacterium sp. TaxID=51671 RepID=UPI002CFCB08F|nr:3-isopropylmalate dehydratase small subunit [Microbacterium sp.]HWL77862.1 3-isopropylmalate dehydratase small subunit [Microbacterium sp.]
MSAVTKDRLGGRSIVFGDDINTDVIIPGRYLVSIDPIELGTHAFEPLGPEVQAKLKESRVVVAGRNFGCGSAREQASTCLIGVGVTAVVARSYSRVFFRNAINTGLVAVECPAAVDAITEGDEVWVDYEAGTVTVGDRSFPFTPFPPVLREILEAGGLIEHLMKKFAKEKS